VVPVGDFITRAVVLINFCLPMLGGKNKIIILWREIWIWMIKKRTAKPLRIVFETNIHPQKLTIKISKFIFNINNKLYLYIKYKIFKNQKTLLPMKRTLHLLIWILVINAPSVFAQNASPVSFTIPIGQILAAMPGGYTFVDGSLVYCEKIGGGSGDITQAGFGDYNTPDFLGGPFDGCDPLTGCTAVTPPIPVATNGTLLSSYVGNHAVGTFTRFTTIGSTVDDGNTTNFENFVGLHIWFNEPVTGGQFAFIDIDGNLVSTAEWLCAFAFLNETLVLPSNVDYLPSSDPNYGVTLATDPLVNDSWNTSINTASSLPAVHTQFRTPTVTTGTNPGIIKRALSQGNADPDNLGAQANFTFGETSLINHVFNLWGVLGHVGSATNQSSGISGMTVTVYPDFGDAPDSYHTLFASNGPSNGIWNNIRIGNIVGSELNGAPSANANSDTDDDGITTVPNLQTSVQTGVQTQSGLNYSTNVSVKNATGKNAELVGWLDWNINGSFDSTEAVAVNVPSSTAGNQTATLTWTNKTVQNISAGKTFLRIRLSTDSVLTPAKFDGYLSDGEDEDYAVPLVNTTPTGIGLLNLQATLVKNDAHIIWQTSPEDDHISFEIERSFDSKQFKRIGEMDTMAHNASANTYDFTDNDIRNSANANVYYRLKMISENHTAEYSNWVVLSMSNQKQIAYNVFPNPNKGSLQFNMLTNVNNIIISDISGRILKSIKAQNIIHNTVDISDLNNGVYFVTYQFENSNKIVRKITLNK
jgi:hypothetical protein